MNGKELLTPKRLLKDYRCGVRLVAFSFFFLAGLAVELSPFVYWGGSVTKLLTNMAAMLVLSVPFCYFIGYRNLAETVRVMRKIKNGDFAVETDVVTRRRRVQGSANGNDRMDGQIDLECYSARTGKTVWVSRQEHSETKIGDKYYTVYLTLKKKESLFAAYPEKKFELDDSLRMRMRSN